MKHLICLFSLFLFIAPAGAQWTPSYPATVPITAKVRVRANQDLFQSVYNETKQATDNSFVAGVGAGQAVRDDANARFHTFLGRLREMNPVLFEGLAVEMGIEID